MSTCSAARGVGALRAAELDSFGMRGVGWVYQAFRDGTLDRDDEVAVGHAAAEDGYRPLSEAMVNIRRTLPAAEQQGIISAATRGILLTAGTALFYPERTWPALLRAAEAARADRGRARRAAAVAAGRAGRPAGRRRRGHAARDARLPRRRPGTAAGELEHGEHGDVGGGEAPRGHPAP